MQKEQYVKKTKGTGAVTDAQKVKQEIINDVNNGQGAMTSREAGAMRD